MTFNEFHGHFLTREEAAALTHRAPSALAEHPDVFTLPGRNPGEELYPALQFGRDGVPTPGLGTLTEKLSSKLAAREIASFCTHPMRTLGGRTPIEWLRAGGPMEVAERAAFAE